MGRSHKETNTYRFQNFTERMKLMHIDVVHQIRKKVDENEEEDSTHFGNALTKWIDLNCTQNFDDFKEDMQQCPCSTYVELVYHAESIIVLLKKHLLVPNTLALEPLLDLLVQMGRDLGPDFYEHFKEVFEILIQVLNASSKDSDTIEKIFTTMAHLYKFLRKYLIKNIYTVYGYFSSLLTHSKEYIRRFAAESFAFLMRKVKDQDALVHFLFSDLKENPEKAEGVGGLLFEMVKGVSEQFHTVSEEVFGCILSKLGRGSGEDQGRELPLEVVEETVGGLMKACAEYTNHNAAAQLWTVLLGAITEATTACTHTTTTDTEEKDGPSHLDHLSRLLRMTHIWLTHHKGSIVSDPSAVAKVLIAVLKGLTTMTTTTHRETIATDLLAVISSLLLNTAERLSVETTARLVSLVFSTDFTLEQVKTFSLSLFDSPLFEKDVLPGLLGFMARRFDTASPSLRGDMLCVLADIVQGKTTCPEEGSQLKRLQVYSLDFGRMQRGVQKTLVQHIRSVVEEGGKSSSVTMDKQALSELLAAVVCLPHISILDSSLRAKALSAAWQNLKQQLAETSSPVMQEAVLYVMQKALLSLLVLRADISVQDLLPADQVLHVLKNHPGNYSVVHGADLYLTLMSDLEKDDLLTPDLLLEVYPVVEPNLVSWSHKVRLSTLHLLTLFPVSVPVPMEQNNQEEEEEWTAFSVALAAERVPLTVRDYRHRLMYLRKLDHSLVHTIMPAGPFAKMPMLYLMGTLLCPMTLLWQPVRELIATHARGLERDVFWQPFSHWLTMATSAAEERTEEGDTTTTTAADPEMLVDKWLTQERLAERSADYLSFRDQLWRTMSLFPEKCEPRSRDVVPLFLLFLQKEYYKTDLSMAPTQDISVEGNVSGKDDVDADDTAVNDDDDDDEEEQAVSKGESTAGKKPSTTARGKSAVLSLLAHLELFTKMQNPRSLYKEGQLHDIFLQFLEHRNSQVQTAAFRCVMTYRHKFLTPYRENFERLLDDKTFKTEVVLFSVDQESTEISPEHRQQLLPYLMRILYGKMLSKAGNETSGKRRSDVRRSIVFRFLGGCTSQELQCFLGLVFGPFKDFITDDPVQMVKEALAVDLKKAIPPKRMKGVLGAVLVVTEKLGNLLHDNAASILHLLLGMAATCAGCLQHRYSLKPSAALMLKSVRQMAFRRLIQFFAEFDSYNFTEEESNAIMDAFVWPQLERLSVESKCQPSLLLKLLHAWCQHPRHFHLLTKKTLKGDHSPLQAMFALLSCEGVGRGVSVVILKAVESLLEGEEDQEEDQPPPHKRRKIVKETAISQGVLMVRPHVAALLTFIEGSVSTMGRQQDKHQKGGATKETILELKILARISTYIEDEEQAVRLCQLLVPFLAASFSVQQELEESTVESILNLMQMVKNPRPFFRPLVPLFLSIERRHSRVILCQILKVIGSKVTELKEISDIVEKLNAWNPRQAEEPDYKTRLDTFTEVNQTLKDWSEVKVDFLLPLIYNCCFFIRTFDDLSLRDNSTFCLVNIVQRFKALTSDPDLYREVIAEAILPHVKKGLRSKQQAVRHEFLAVLQAMVLAFPDHRDFQGLPALQDTDIESDFFENIRHIQIHKQAKALRRLSHHLHSHRLRADQHMGFFLPLLYSYVLDKHYAKSGKILDAAVDLTCMMCRQLPWESYYQLLRLYLSHLPRHLDNQRIIIRVIVAILDAFHFDLSQSQFRFSAKPKLKEEAATEEETQGEGEEQTEKTTEASPEAEEPLEALDVAEVSNVGDGQLMTVSDATYSADRRDVCAPGLASRIHRMVLTSLIPQLQKTLTEKVKSDDIHKLAQTKYAEDEEVLRVPLAMAMIKLLQKLPDQALDHKLPGIMMRVCNFLKSRAQDIRMTARDTLVKAVQSIGARYLPFIIKEMRAVLTRGYQLHVLSFSVYHLLKSITDILKPGDLDPALDDLQAIYKEELFGSVSEEKSVEGITSQLFEAKSIKGYLAYKIMAQYISPQYLGTLVHPLKTLLEGTHSQRVANKVRMVLQSVSSGLLANSALTLETLMVFIHSLTQDNLPSLQEQPAPSPISESSGLSRPQQPESCLLIPKETPRGGVKPKTSKKTTLDVLVEFGLVLLHSCLKSGRLQSNSAEHWGYLDPLVPSLVKCLALKYVRVNSAVLRCMEWLLPFPLPALKKHISKVARHLFFLLKNYASAGAAKGDNQELVFTCFKAVTVLVREVKYHKLSTEHLQVLLTYCEEDIHDNTRQSTAFSVIKAILKRRLNVAELRDLMSTIETMSITAQASHVRVQCREVVVHYLRDYPLGKKLQNHFAFYIRQLSYEHEEGRLSALSLLRAVFSSLDEEILQKYSGLFFLPLSICMSSDGAIACRDLAMAAMKTLLEKINTDSRDRLYALVQTWLSQPKVTACSMAVQLCGLFVEVETTNFTARRQDVFPGLLERDFTATEEEEQDQDRFYVQVMTLIRKVMGLGDLTALAAWTDMDRLLGYVQSHLLHNHSWVRLQACRIMGQVLSLASSDLTTYLPADKAQNLVLTLCTQLQSPLLEEDLALQIMKNMATIARTYHKLSGDGQGVSVSWMAKKLIKEANHESISNAPTTIKRSHVFKWLAFVSQEFDAEVVGSILAAVLPPLMREAENISADEALKQLSQEVMEWLKKKAGVEVFSKVYANIQERRRDTKEKRKQKRAIAAVNNPEISAAKRMKKNRDRKKGVREERKQRKKKTKLSVFH